MDDSDELERLRRLPITEKGRFSAEELVACLKCGRKNAPDSEKCIYCGSTIDGLLASITSRHDLENWEQGFNLVVTDVAENANAITRAAGMLEIEPDAASFNRGMPIARLESEAAAVQIGEKLAAIGVSTRTIADESLAIADPPLRLRSIEFMHSTIRLSSFGADWFVEVERDDLALLVRGAILEEQVHATGRRKRGAYSHVTETTISGHEPLIDLYRRHDRRGWRVQSTGFDFSCLESAKSMLVAQNMNRLAGRLSEFSPQMKVVEDYLAARPMLENVWPSEMTRTADGLRRSGFRLRKKSHLTVSNLAQFTRYSRLQWHLL